MGERNELLDDVDIEVTEGFDYVRFNSDVGLWLEIKGDSTMVEMAINSLTLKGSRRLRDVCEQVNTKLQRLHEEKGIAR